MSGSHCERPEVSVNLVYCKAVAEEEFLAIDELQVCLYKRETQAGRANNSEMGTRCTALESHRSTADPRTAGTEQGGIVGKKAG